jgi:hypothetical protein
VCVFVHGFEPYFYADCPADFSPEYCGELCRVLQVRGLGRRQQLGGGWRAFRRARDWSVGGQAGCRRSCCSKLLPKYCGALCAVLHVRWGRVSTSFASASQREGACCVLSRGPASWLDRVLMLPNLFVQEHGRLKDKSNLGVPPVSRVEVVQRTNLWGYQAGGARSFLKITCALPNLVTSCRSECVVCSRGSISPSYLYSTVQQSSWL